MTRTIDPYDELAAMFLTRPDTPGEGGVATAPTTTTTFIELVVAGHLPVRAGLWLTPYADAVARQLGTTALVRLDRDEPVLQVLRGNEDGYVLPAGGSLRDTINDLVHSATTWVIYGGAASETAELLKRTPDRITILSSADDAAVVAAYQHVKNLVSTSEAMQSKLPTIGLAVLGADDIAANRVFDRVNRTTTAFLGVELELSKVLPRMDANVRSTSYVNYPGERTPVVAEVIKWVLEARTSATEVEHTPVKKPQPAPPAPPPVPQRVEPIQEFDEPTRLTPQERELLHEPVKPTAAPGSYHFSGIESQTPKPATPPITPAPAAKPQEQTTEQDDLNRPLIEYAAYATPRQYQQAQQQQSSQQQFAAAHGAQPARVIPRPLMELEPKRNDSNLEPDQNGRPVPLSKYVDDLTPIAPRCPGRERIELAVGRFGRIHLLGREDCLREMHFVQTWAKAHCELISMACPNVTIDPAAKPVCHVFTDKPVKLNDLHGSDVKLHVLAPVDVNGQTGWFAAPLN